MTIPLDTLPDIVIERVLMSMRFSYEMIFLILCSATFRKYLKVFPKVFCDDVLINIAGSEDRLHIILTVREKVLRLYFIPNALNFHKFIEYNSVGGMPVSLWWQKFAFIDWDPQLTFACGQDYKKVAVEVLHRLMEYFKIHKVMKVETNGIEFNLNTEFISFAKLMHYPSETLKFECRQRLDQASLESLFKNADHIQNLKLKVLTQDVPWQTTHVFKMKNLNIDGASWFGEEALLKSECQLMFLVNPDFTIDTFYEFIEQWLAGSHEKFQQLKIVTECFTELGKVTDFKRMENMRSTEQIAKEEGLNDAELFFYDLVDNFAPHINLDTHPSYHMVRMYHIRRKDGAIATMQTQYITSARRTRLFRFTVWRKGSFPFVDTSDQCTRRPTHLQPKPNIMSGRYNSILNLDQDSFNRFMENCPPTNRLLMEHRCERLRERVEACPTTSNTLKIEGDRAGERFLIWKTTNGDIFRFKICIYGYCIRAADIGPITVGGMRVCCSVDGLYSYHLQASNPDFVTIQMVKWMARQHKMKLMIVDGTSLPKETIVECAKIATENSLRSFSLYHRNKRMRQETVEQLLMVANPRKALTIRVLTSFARWNIAPREFSYEFFHVETGHWCNAAVLMASNCRRMYFDKCLISYKNINQFIKKWIDGGFERLRHLKIRMDAPSITLDKRFYGKVRDVYKDLVLLDDAQIRAAMEVPDGTVFHFFDQVTNRDQWNGKIRHLRREDGTAATLHQQDKYNFYFAVWKDDFPFKTRQELKDANVRTTHRNPPALRSL